MNLRALGPASLTTLAASAPNWHLGAHTDTRGEPARYTLRYSIGGGDTTRIVLWSAEEIVTGYHIMAMFDDEQVFKSVNVRLPHKQLNIIDPALIAGIPIGFENGFIRWNAPRSSGNRVHVSADCDPQPATNLSQYTDTAATAREC